MPRKSAKESPQVSATDPSKIYPPVIGKASKKRGLKLTAASCEISTENSEGFEEIQRALVLLFGKDEIVTRSLEQNEKFHADMRAMAKRWNEMIESGEWSDMQRITEESMKEMILLAFGNKRLIKFPGGSEIAVAMRTHRYKRTPSDLTEAEKRAGHVSMCDLMNEYQAWAARELMLDLETGEVMGEAA